MREEVKLVYGSAIFNSPLEKKKIIQQLKREFSEGFTYRIDNNLISYETEDTSEFILI